MLGNSSFSLNGATPKALSGALGFDPNANYGIKKTPVATPVAKAPIYPTPNGQAPTQGTNTGMIKSTTSPQGTVTNYETKSNPSVLAQQQMLNKQYGAGLVEDGIIGDKTRAAIAKYLGGNSGSSQQQPAYDTTTGMLTAYGKSLGLPEVNAPKNNLSTYQTPQANPATETPYTVAGLLPSLQKAGEVTPWEQQVREGSAVKDANKALTDFRLKEAEVFGNNDSQAIPLVFQQGRKQVLQRQAAEQENALQQGVGNALTNQGQQFSAAQAQASRGLSGAQTALGAVAPQFPSYGSQIIQPGLLGTQNQGGGGGLESAVSNVVQRLQNGTMTYNDAVNALSGYGQGGLNALQQALPPGFNIAQSNTLAGQQGSVNVNYQLADTALKNVEDIINQLAGPQKTNVPAINKVANWISTQFGIGSEQTRAMTGAVQSLRNAYASLLASVKGGTPTDYSSQAMAEIPAEPTPNDIAAIRKNFEVLGKARKDILGNPGQAGTSGSTGGGFAEVW